MVSDKDFILLNVTEREFMAAANQACHEHFSEHMDREDLVSLTDRAVGTCGEFGLKNFFQAAGISCERKHDHFGEAYSGDIDLVIYDHTAEITCESKTSHIPDRDSRDPELFCCNEDIKIMRHYKTPVSDMTRDIYMQIMVNRSIYDKYEFVERLKIAGITDVPQDKDSIRSFGKMLIDFYADRLYFSAWNIREDIITAIYKMPVENRVWHINQYSQPVHYWTAKIRNGKKPSELIQYLKDQLNLRNEGKEAEKVLIRSQDKSRFVILSEGMFLSIVDKKNGMWGVDISGMPSAEKTVGLQLGIYNSRAAAGYVVNEVFDLLGGNTSGVKYDMPSNETAEKRLIACKNMQS